MGFVVHKGFRWGDVGENNPAHKFEFYKGTYRMNGMDQVRKAMTA